MEYATEIARMVEAIIEFKNYEMLTKILVDYDRLKKKENDINNDEHTFWQLLGKE